MTCNVCKRAGKHSAYLILGGRFVCADCAYELEHGGAERLPTRARRRPIQVETLFVLPPSEQAK